MISRNPNANKRKSHPMDKDDEKLQLFTPMVCDSMSMQQTSYYKPLNITIPGVPSNLYKTLTLPPDGNCLYRAVAYARAGNLVGTELNTFLEEQIKSLRRQVADKLRSMLTSNCGANILSKNRDEAISEIKNRLGMNHDLYRYLQDFPNYNDQTIPISQFLDKIEKTSMDAGDLEIALIEKILGRRIIVLQLNQKKEVVPLQISSLEDTQPFPKIFICYDKQALHYQAIQTNNSPEMYKKLQEHFLPNRITTTTATTSAVSTSQIRQATTIPVQPFEGYPFVSMVPRAQSSAAFFTPPPISFSSFSTPWATQSGLETKKSAAPTVPTKLGFTPFDFSKL